MVNAGRIGMRPEFVEARLNIVSQHSAALATLSHEVRQTGNASISPWNLIFPPTLILTGGSIALAHSAAGDVDSAVESAEQLIGRLRGEIVAQRLASSADDSSYYVMTRSDASQLYRDALKDPSALDGLTPLQVKAWWDQLSDAERDEFVREQTLAAGNIDGIPLAVRAEANRYSAIERLDERGLTETERIYLERVKSGEVILVAYDPANDSIVEAIGLGVMDFRADPDNPTFVQGATWGPDGELLHKEPPKHVITYVPGTGSDLATFYGEDNYQAFGHGIIRGNEDTSVVFVYKGGPFASGLDEAKSQPFTLETGATLASFTTAVGMETGLSGAQTHAVAHSWGLANVTASELAGARYDSVISLAGAWMPDGWQPQPDTNYTHHSYADWLRGVQGIDNGINPFDVIGSGNFPGDSDAFEQHWYRGPNDDKLIPSNPFSPGDWGDAKDAWSDNHGLIHDTADPNNANATRNIRDDIYAN